MVGGGNTITTALCQKEMEELLGEYRKNVYKNKVSHTSDPRVTLLENCMDKLDPDEKELIVCLCVDGVSERTCADKLGLTRYRVREEKKRLIALLVDVYNASLCKITDG